MNRYLFLCVVLVFLLGELINGQDSLNISQKDSIKISNLEKRIKLLEDKSEKDELDKLLGDAESVSREKEKKKESKTFKSGQRALQAINPEISVTGDAYGQYIMNMDGFTEEQRSGAFFRVAGVHIQSNLDPFSSAKAIIEFSPEGAELGEAYMTWGNMLPNLSMTAGKFRQQFGVVNRWHKHALDQFDFPLALRTIFGEEGLNQIGISFNWLMPSITADANNLIVEITNGQNEQLFEGEMITIPSVLMHLKNYYDLSSNTYLELGLTGMYGQNNFRGYNKGNKVIEKTRSTYLGGIDLTLFWEPNNKAKYHSFLWRSELYYANKNIGGGDIIKTFGGYSYVEYKMHEQWQVGTRFDYTQPFELNNSSKYTYQVVPYVTWWQSHWVKLRLLYNYTNGNISPDSNNTLRLQLGWSIGPHKHDRY